MYSVKIYSFTVIQRSYSKLHRYLGNRVHCVLFLKCIGTYLLIKVNSKEIFQTSIQCLNILTYEFSKNFATCILQNS